MKTFEEFMESKKKKHKKKGGLRLAFNVGGEPVEIAEKEDSESGEESESDAEDVNG